MLSGSLRNGLMTPRGLNTALFFGGFRWYSIWRCIIRCNVLSLSPCGVCTVVGFPLPSAFGRSDPMSTSGLVMTDSACFRSTKKL